MLLAYFDYKLGHRNIRGPVTTRKQMIDSILSIILLILSLVNVCVHSIGAYLLISLYGTSRHKAQWIYLVNLSICECVMNILESIRVVLKFVSLYYNVSSIFHTFRYYILIVSFTGVTFGYYVGIILLTFDRLMIIVLNLNYTEYWNEIKAKYFLIATWSISFLICTLVSLLYKFKHFQWENFFFLYFYPTVDLLFMLLAIFTYSRIFYKFYKSETKMARLSNIRQPRTSMLINDNVMQIPSSADILQSTQGSGKSYKYKTFKKSVFYIPLLLILSFLVFVATPDLTYMFVGTINNNVSDILLAACSVSYAVSDLCDAWIYIYLQHDVRSLLLSKLDSLKCNRLTKQKSELRLVSVASSTTEKTNFEINFDVPIADLFFC